MLKFIFLFIFFEAIFSSQSAFIDNIYNQQGEDAQEFIGPATLFRTYTDRDNNVKDIHLRFYNGSTLSDFIEIELMDSMKLLNEATFIKDNPTVFYIHGYKENASMESVKTVIGAYLSVPTKRNIIFVDWSNMASGSYFINAAPNTRKVAKALASELKKLLEGGLNFEDLHIVGHSLGGQTAGFVGKEMQSLGIKLRRISALDPAFPGFYPGLVLNHIDKADAYFVDVIHTDSGGFGAQPSTGTVDFRPNGGIRIQPGCPHMFMPGSPEDLCSHWRSWRFWAESVINPKAFPSIKAKSYEEFLEIVKNKSFKDNAIVYMGIAADTKSTNDYYLFTNAATPFGRGQV